MTKYNLNMNMHTCYVCCCDFQNVTLYCMKSWGNYTTAIEYSNSKRVLGAQSQMEGQSVHIEYLSFPVDSNDTSSRFMGGSDKNGLSADPVHVDTSSSLQIIQVDVAIFGYQKDYILLGTDLDVQKDNLI